MELPNDIYNYIYSLVPRVCIDLVIKPDNKTDKILLGQRIHEPFIGQWAIPGSRLRFGESIDKAIRRILIEEVNYLNGYNNPLFMGYIDFSNEISLMNRHSVSLVFEINAPDFYIFSPTESFEKISFFNRDMFQHLNIIPNHLDFINKHYT